MRAGRTFGGGRFFFAESKQSYSAACLLAVLRLKLDVATLPPRTRFPVAGLPSGAGFPPAGFYTTLPGRTVDLTLLFLQISSIFNQLLKIMSINCILL